MIIGRVKTPSTADASVVERTATGIICSGFVELKRAPFEMQEQAIESILEHQNLRRMCLDASGIGLQLSELTRNRFGSRVEPVTFSLPVREGLAALMLRVFQNGEIAIPDEPALLADLHSVERQITPAGNIRYAAPREEGSHADRFMALALALHACETRRAVGVYGLDVPALHVGSDSSDWVSWFNEALWTPV